MWRIFFISHVGLSKCQNTWCWEEFPVCIITYHMLAHSRQSERQNIINRMHTWQQCSVTISEDISTTKYAFKLRLISSVHINNNTNTLIGDCKIQCSVLRMCELVCTFTQVGTLLKQHTLVASPTPPIHSVAWFEKVWGTVLNATVPISLPGDHSPGTWCYDVCLMFTTALKIAPKPCIPFLEIEHNQGKCTLFYCCFNHDRMLAYKILACEVCMIWQKSTEALKKTSPIAKSRTGKPATLWVNIYVCSHLGCETPFSSIFCKSHKYFKDTKAMQITGFEN